MTRLLLFMFLSLAASGQRYDVSGNAGAASVTVTASGAQSKSTTSSSTGAYALMNLKSGSYVVTPQKAGFTFTPSSQSIALTSNKTGVNFSVTQPPPPPTGTLVIAWGLDEASGNVATDASGTGNAGVINNAARVPGKYGQAVLFNGSSSVQAPDSNSLDLVVGTVECWYKLSAVGTWRSLIAKGASNLNAAHNYFIEFQPDDAFIFGIGNGVSDNYGTTSAYSDMSAYHHVAMTWNGSTILLYVDGVLAGTRAQTIAASGNNAVLNVGVFGGGTDYFSGVIDEVRVYGKVLTQSEIQADMATPINSVAPPPPPSAHTVTLSWTASTSGGVVGYNVYRGTSSGGPYASVATNVAGVTYLDANVSAGLTYFYVATAVDSSSESAYSAEVQAIVPIP